MQNWKKVRCILRYGHETLKTMLKSEKQKWNNNYLQTQSLIYSLIYTIFQIEQEITSAILIYAFVLLRMNNNI